MEFILLIGLIVLVFFVIGMVRRKNTLADMQIQASTAPPLQPAKPIGQNAWRITEPLGGRTNIGGHADLLDYVNGVLSRAGR